MEWELSVGLSKSALWVWWGTYANSGPLEIPNLLGLLLSIFVSSEFPCLLGLQLSMFMSSEFPCLLGLVVVTPVVLACLKLSEFGKLKSMYKGTHGLLGNSS